MLAALSPWLIDGIRSAYVSLGGTPELGDGPGTALRLGLSLLVLGLPTFFMGGTLPAVVRAVERVEDPNRRHLGLLYGLNTLGAVGGVLLATFLAIEWWGIRQTLWTAVAVNLMVAGTAIWLASRRPPHPEKAKHTATAVPTEAPPTLVLTAAAGTGFLPVGAGFSPPETGFSPVGTFPMPYT